MAKNAEKLTYTSNVNTFNAFLTPPPHIFYVLQSISILMHDISHQTLLMYTVSWRQWDAILAKWHCISGMCKGVARSGKGVLLVVDVLLFVLEKLKLTKGKALFCELFCVSPKRIGQYMYMYIVMPQTNSYIIFVLLYLFSNFKQFTSVELN